MSKDDLFMLSVVANVLLSLSLVQLYQNIKHNKEKK
jgi:hypothetical protein